MDKPVTTTDCRHPVSDSPDLTVMTTENSILVTLFGVQDDVLARRYLAKLDAFVRERNTPWARIVDLRQWQITLPEVQQVIIDTLNRDIHRGLSVECIVLPVCAMSRWQVQRTVDRTSNPEVFHQLEDMNSAFEILDRRGFSTQFT